MKNIHTPCHPEAASDAARRIPSALQKPQGILPLRFAQGQNDKKRTRMTRAERGFTLVELIVVIVIIGIVAGLVTANLIGARQRARDAQRKSDLRQIQAAFELYRADAGSYPLASNFPTCGSQFASGTAVYMQKVPCDPSTSTSYSYSSGIGTPVNSYILYACLENGSDSERDAARGLSEQCGSDGYSFTVTNP